MAGFETHISVSTALGLTYGTVGYLNGMPLPTCAVAAGLCSVGGMIPDLDGDTGVPVRETIDVVAVGVPALCIGYFQVLGLDREMMAIAVASMYLLIRFVVAAVFKSWTRHRGMWHSIPAAINVGLIAFILCSGPEVEHRLFKASAIVLGFLSHLLMDEIYSIDLKRFRMKNSFGTALKFWSGRAWPNVMTYGITAALVYLAYQDPTVKEYMGQKMVQLEELGDETVMHSESPQP